MSLLEADNSNVDPNINAKETKNALRWIQIGVDFRKAKAKDKTLTAKAFAASMNINYGTFTKSMFRYKDSIDAAIEAEKSAKKPWSKLTKQERAVMMINSFRKSMKDKTAMGKLSVRKKTDDWFRDTIKKTVRGHQVTSPEPGKLYAYVYDAKHKATLPVWDVYPLIICLGFGGTASGEILMYGLNLHYIPPKARQQLLEELLKQYANTPVISNKTKLKVKWSDVKGFRGANSMIKAYIPGRIQGKLVEIKPADWANVVLLPTQQFKSQGKNVSAAKVWAQSMSK